MGIWNHSSYTLALRGALVAKMGHFWSAAPTFWDPYLAQATGPRQSVTFWTLCKVSVWDWASGSVSRLLLFSMVSNSVSKLLGFKKNLFWIVLYLVSKKYRKTVLDSVLFRFWLSSQTAVHWATMATPDHYYMINGCDNSIFGLASHVINVMA